ncbi:DUF2116 family Zn-ribbon domain-containing protein [Candidatus Kaiserbacteria bacterium]|nr:DUF2116 family Zn-ribbon domain-containing protein [Candidatus Kaiserbacteria bacterium]
MADECDFAQEYQDFQTSLAIQAALKKSTPQEHRSCLNCHTPTAQGSAFCDTDCRDDFEKRNRR